MKNLMLLAAGLLCMPALAGCAAAPSSSGSITPDMSTTPPSPDPRVGLRAGGQDPGEASWNMRLVSNTPASERFVGVTNSDLAFSGSYAIQGNYNGFQVWDIANAERPTLTAGYLCPASQSDVSIYRNLLFVSGEGQTGRLDCGTQGVPEPVSHERLRGIRIFDATDIRNPKYIANVQTCRGSHTHTVVTDPNDSQNVYIYVSGSSRVRSPDELPGCSDLSPTEDQNSALFRIEVIRVPLANPERAAIVSSPRIFDNLAAAPRHGEPGQPAREPDPARTGPSQCHDITVYPDIGLAGGACGGYGLLLDIRDVTNPRRIFAAADSNMAFWHSATFSNDGDKVLFTDEWGGGSSPRCRATDKYEWGANALFTIEDRELVFRSYYKMPAAQTEFENCVAHNGNLIPIPGREVMVQAWYQGGISVFDWTDVSNPKEIAYFDRGPMDDTRRVGGGSWSVYWYNGDIVSSEIARGLDIFELLPSAFISQNEIDAAKTVRVDFMNAQEQRRIVWPPSFPLALAYLDQLERSGGLAADGVAGARGDLANAQAASGAERQRTLTALATRLNGAASGSRDAAKVRTLARAVSDLAAAQN
ncbi:MAG: hypothetical protein WEF86_10665 [Gemmatimonadota bacterium]